MSIIIIIIISVRSIVHSRLHFFKQSGGYRLTFFIQFVYQSTNIENMQLSNLARLKQSGTHRLTFQLDYKYGKRANFREMSKKISTEETPRVLVVFTGTSCFAFGLVFFLVFFFRKKKVHLHESLLQVHNPMQNLIFRDLNVPFSFFLFFFLFFWLSETGFK